MDLTVILGMLGALASIAIGDLMEGGNPAHVIHVTSLIIVIPTAMFALQQQLNRMLFLLLLKN